MKHEPSCLIYLCTCTKKDKQKVYDALDVVVKELCEMSNEEFDAALERGEL